MNLAIKLMMFSIMLNLATGIMITALPTQFADAGSSGLEYDSEYAADLTNEMNESINPQDEMDDTSDLFDRLLDKLTIGVWSKFLGAINKYLYGFVQVLNVVIGQRLDEGIRMFLFGDHDTLGAVKWALNIAYIITAITLWTGRDLRK